MAIIESALGKVQSQNSSSLRNYVVEDPTLLPEEEPRVNNQLSPQVQQVYQERLKQVQKVRELSEDEKFFMQANEECPVEVFETKVKAKKEVITESRKQKLELLLGLKKVKKSIVIDEYKIVLQNLSSSDMKCVFDKIADKTTMLDQMYYARQAYLAYSLYSFDGELISDLLGEDDGFEMRLSIIENMSDSVVNELYKFYETEIDFQPKNNEEAKEVVSDIKKS
jgi:hypothetical protein